MFKLILYIFFGIVRLIFPKHGGHLEFEVMSAAFEEYSECKQLLLCHRGDYLCDTLAELSLVLQFSGEINKLLREVITQYAFLPDSRNDRT